MITDAEAQGHVSGATNAGHASIENLRPASRPLTLDEINSEYGWTFTSVTDLWAEIETASDWRQLDSVRSKVREYLDVDPPVLTRVDGDALLRAVNARLDSPPVGSADDWLRLSQSQQRAVRMLVDRIDQGPWALSLSPDQHRAIVLGEVERVARAGLPASIQSGIAELLNRSLHCEMPNLARADVQSIRDRLSRGLTDACIAGPPASAMSYHSAASHGCLTPWANDVRCFPRCLVRGALLRPTKASPIYLGRITRIRSLAGILITGRGQTLSQADLDVCLAALHLARRQPVGPRGEVTLAALIEAAGRTDGERTRAGVIASLRRLSRFNFSVELQKPAKAFRGTLLENVSIHRRRRDGRHCVSYVVPSGMLDLFAPSHVRILMKERVALAGHPLACWLQMFIASHDRVHPILVTTYHELTGLRCSIGEFRRLLQRALDVLVANSVVASARIEDGKVYVTKVKAQTSKQT
jgi:hypothetical protein